MTRRALQAQDTLGWYQAINGRLLTLCWQDAQAVWIVNIATKYKRSSASKWAGQAALAILEIEWQLWEHRNHIYHDPAHTWSQQCQDDLTQQIQQNFGAHTSAKVLRRDHHLFNIPPQGLRPPVPGSIIIKNLLPSAIPFKDLSLPGGCLLTTVRYMSSYCIHIPMPVTICSMFCVAPVACVIFQLDLWRDALCIKSTIDSSS
jgi:hypothetical protein